jgi:hypothetical protein
MVYSTQLPPWSGALCELYIRSYDACDQVTDLMIFVFEQSLPFMILSLTSQILSAAGSRS